jgi:predicted nucleic acid-binding protein
MTYALDTNIVIHYLQNNPNVHKHIDGIVLQSDDIAIPIYVNYEIKRGLSIYQAPRKEKTYDALVNSDFCSIAEMDGHCWKRAVLIYEELYRKRLTIGELDILIAAICHENNYTLVTDNEKHFKDIDGLSYENWVT